MKHRAGARSGLCIDRMGWHGWKSRGGVGYGAPEDANKTIYIFKAVLTDMCVSGKKLCVTGIYGINIEGILRTNGNFGKCEKFNTKRLS